MTSSNESRPETERLKCPECRASLKKRRSRRVDACEMVCGGCGRIFDICDAVTRESLQKSD